MFSPFLILIVWIWSEAGFAYSVRRRIVLASLAFIVRYGEWI